MVIKKIRTKDSHKIVGIIVDRFEVKVRNSVSSTWYESEIEVGIPVTVLVVVAVVVMQLTVR